VRELTERGVTVEFVKDRLTFRGGVDGADAQGTLMLTILAAIAGFERALIRERQREGIAIAKAKGVYSRPRRKKVTAEQVTELVTLARDGMPKAELSRSYGISRETLYQYMRGSV
jgi:DNA invertase Pin-like site-specific DNA recombinase